MKGLSGGSSVLGPTSTGAVGSPEGGVPGFLRAPEAPKPQSVIETPSIPDPVEAARQAVTASEADEANNAIGGSEPVLDALAKGEIPSESHGQEAGAPGVLNLVGSIDQPETLDVRVDGASNLTQDARGRVDIFADPLYQELVVEPVGEFVRENTDGSQDINAFLGERVSAFVDAYPKRAEAYHAMLSEKVNGEAGTASDDDRATYDMLGKAIGARLEKEITEGQAEHEQKVEGRNELIKVAGEVVDQARLLRTEAIEHGEALSDKALEAVDNTGEASKVVPWGRGPGGELDPHFDVQYQEMVDQPASEFASQVTTGLSPEVREEVNRRYVELMRENTQRYVDVHPDRAQTYVHDADIRVANREIERIGDIHAMLRDALIAREARLLAETNTSRPIVPNEQHAEMGGEEAGEVSTKTPDASLAPQAPEPVQAVSPQRFLRDRIREWQINELAEGRHPRYEEVQAKIAEFRKDYPEGYEDPPVQTVEQGPNESELNLPTGAAKLSFHEDIARSQARPEEGKKSERTDSTSSPDAGMRIGPTGLPEELVSTTAIGNIKRENDELFDPITGKLKPRPPGSAKGLRRVAAGVKRFLRGGESKSAWAMSLDPNYGKVPYPEWGSLRSTRPDHVRPTAQGAPWDSREIGGTPEQDAMREAAMESYGTHYHTEQERRVAEAKKGNYDLRPANVKTRKREEVKQDSAQTENTHPESTFDTQAFLGAAQKAYGKVDTNSSTANPHNIDTYAFLRAARGIQPDTETPTAVNSQLIEKPQTSEFSEDIPLARDAEGNLNMHEDPVIDKVMRDVLASRDPKKMLSASEQSEVVREAFHRLVRQDPDRARSYAEDYGARANGLNGNTLTENQINYGNEYKLLLEEVNFYDANPIVQGIERSYDERLTNLQRDPRIQAIVLSDYPEQKQAAIDDYLQQNPNDADQVSALFPNYVSSNTSLAQAA